VIAGRRVRFAEQRGSHNLHVGFKRRQFARRQGDELARDPRGSRCHLKQAVSSGEYKLDPTAIASSMIDEHA